jgi:hypothetical protein
MPVTYRLGLGAAAMVLAFASSLSSSCRFRAAAVAAASAAAASASRLTACTASSAWLTSSASSDKSELPATSHATVPSERITNHAGHSLTYCGI